MPRILSERAAAGTPASGRIRLPSHVRVRAEDPAVASRRPPVASCRPPVASRRSPVASRRLPVAEGRHRTTAQTPRKPAKRQKPGPRASSPRTRRYGPSPGSGHSFGSRLCRSQHPTPEVRARTSTASGAIWRNAKRRRPRDAPLTHGGRAPCCHEPLEIEAGRGARMTRQRQ